MFLKSVFYYMPVFSGRILKGINLDPGSEMRMLTETIRSVEMNQVV